MSIGWHKENKIKNQNAFLNKNVEHSSTDFFQLSLKECLTFDLCQIILLLTNLEIIKYNRVYIHVKINKLLLTWYKNDDKNDDIKILGNFLRFLLNNNFFMAKIVFYFKDIIFKSLSLYN